MILARRRAGAVLRVGEQSGQALHPPKVGSVAASRSRQMPDLFGAHGRSQEAELRAPALLTPARRNLAELLAAVPPGGLDADFARRPQADEPADFTGTGLPLLNPFAES